MSPVENGNNSCAALKQMLLQKAPKTTADVNVSTCNCSNLILANVRQKLKRGKTKSKQSKAGTQADGLVMGSRLAWLLSDKGKDVSP